MVNAAGGTMTMVGIVRIKGMIGVLQMIIQMRMAELEAIPPGQRSIAPPPDGRDPGGRRSRQDRLPRHADGYALPAAERTGASARPGSLLDQPAGNHPFGARPV